MPLVIEAATALVALVSVVTSILMYRNGEGAKTKRLDDQFELHFGRFSRDLYGKLDERLKEYARIDHVASRCEILSIETGKVVHSLNNVKQTVNFHDERIRALEMKRARDVKTAD